MAKGGSGDGGSEVRRSNPLRKTSLIRAATMEVTFGGRQGMLLWVHTGRAYVAVGAARLRANEGQGLWIPRDAQCTVSTPRDSLAIPLPVFTDDSPYLLPEMMTVTVPEDVQPGLLWQFTRLHGRLRGSVPGAGDLLAFACGEGVSAEFATPSRQVIEWVHASAEGRREAAELPSGNVPPGTVRTRTGTSTVLAWVYRGFARVSMEGREHLLQSGDTIVLPAGVPHEINAEAGTIILPVAHAGEGSLGFDRDRVARVPAERELSLLHSVVSSHTLLRPEGFQPRSEPPQWLRTSSRLSSTLPGFAD